MVGNRRGLENGVFEGYVKLGSMFGVCSDACFAVVFVNEWCKNEFEAS